MAPPLLDVHWTNKIDFSLNGCHVTLSNPPPEMKLITYLRDVAHLTGTKLSCGEGGCGACTVVLCHRPLEHVPSAPASSDVVFRAVNACLFPVCALDGIEVFTVERVGSTRLGLHAIQKRLADENGTQCGFCTPGWVMNMYELVRTRGETKPTKREIEDHFDGNLCRCTGYRPIFSAFHSFADKKKTEDEERVPLAYETNDVATIMEGCDHIDDWLLIDPTTDLAEARTSVCERKCGDKASSCARYSELEDLLPPRPDHAVTAPYDAGAEPNPDPFVINFKPRPLRFEDTETKDRWYRPLTMEQLQSAVSESELCNIMFVGGRTSMGVDKYYNSTAPYNRPTMRSVQIETNYITELKTIQVEPDHNRVVIGASVTINTLLSFLQTFSSNDNYDTAPLTELATLVQRVANNQVRNSGTWAGNLSLCRDHPSFVSDLVVGLMGMGVTLTLATTATLEREEGVTIDQFIQRPRADFALIIAMQLPLVTKTTTDRHVLRCYKVAQRPQNAHSHVNCAIWIKTRTDQNPSVCLDARVVFGGVTARPARFHSTEAFLTGATITNATIQEAFKHAEQDLKQIGPSNSAVGSSTAAFRLGVMRNLLYKALVSAVTVENVDSTVQTAVDRLVRGVSSGTESFKEPDATKPVGKAIRKLGAAIQVSGEAEYTADKPLPSSALYGAILYSRVALGQLISIDKAYKARNTPGVVSILTADDIPGANDISSGSSTETLFVPKHGIVRCVGMPLGLVLATSAEIAERVAAECEVEYVAVPPHELWPGQTDQTPITDIRMAKTAGTLGQKEPIEMGDKEVESKLIKCAYTLEGELMLGAQKHFYMEPQVSVATPQEGGTMLVETSSQFPNFTQTQLAAVLKVPFNAITVKVQRVGGGFGGKLTRCVINAAAAAVAASKFHQTVRVVNDRSADFRLVGGRENMLGSYKVGFDRDGYIKALDMRLDVDCGYLIGDAAGSATMAVQWSDSAYHVPSFRCRAFLYQTNTQACTSLRAPGVPQSLLLHEIVIQHVAETLGLPMQWVQERNLYREGELTPYNQRLEGVRFHEVWDRLVVASHIEQREQAIAVRNSNNKWKKRGIAITPTKYGMDHSGRKDGARIEVFAGDGSVTITHGGCEIGQGIHTKAAQVCAYELGIPMDLIKVRPTSTDQCPNSEATGGSSTSESIARALIACCEELNKRLKPIKEKNPDKSWHELISIAHDKGVCLFAGAQPTTEMAKGNRFDYFVYGAACSEVEVDILTGEINILKSEIVYDCGISLSPAIDIGQIEGGFVMGIGLYLQEEVDYSKHDGDLLTQGTWEYKIPCSKDIPESFKVTLLDNVNNTHGVLNSKATGEPPYALAMSVYFAVKRAIADSRVERGIVGPFQLDIPASVARRQEAAKIRLTDYSL